MKNKEYANSSEKEIYSAEKPISVSCAWWIWLVIGALSLLAGLICFFGGAAAGGAFSFLLGAIFITASFFVPYKYEFDCSGITICYLFGRKHRFPKNKIVSVVCVVKYGRKGTKRQEYVINGTPEAPPASYMQNYIVKTKKTERALKLFFGDKIKK